VVISQSKQLEVALVIVPVEVGNKKGFEDTKRRIRSRVKSMIVVLLLHPNINCITIPRWCRSNILRLFPSVLISVIIFPGLF
jgi:hypothetical protein